MVLYKEQPERVIETQKRLYEVATGKVAEEEDMGVSEIEDIEESVEPPKDRNPKPFHFFQRALTAEWDSLSEKEQQRGREITPAYVLYAATGFRPTEGQRSPNHMTKQQKGSHLTSHAIAISHMHLPSSACLYR